MTKKKVALQSIRLQLCDRVPQYSQGIYAQCARAFRGTLLAWSGTSMFSAAMAPIRLYGRSYVRLLGSTVYRFLERQHTPHSTQMAYISTKHACKHACMVPCPSSRGVSVLWFLSEGFTRIFIHSYTSTSVRVAERGSLISKHLQCTSPAVHLQTAVLIVLLIIHTEVVTIPVQQ